jgi:glutamine synthetase
MSVNLANWIAEHKIDEVECIVPDINGVQRGKVLPAKKFLSSVRDKSLRIPGSVFICTIDGHYPEDIADIWDKDPDKITDCFRDRRCAAWRRKRGRNRPAHDIEKSTQHVCRARVEADYGA